MTVSRLVCPEVSQDDHSVTLITRTVPPNTPQFPHSAHPRPWPTQVEYRQRALDYGRQQNTSQRVSVAIIPITQNLEALCLSVQLEENSSG